MAKDFGKFLTGAGKGGGTSITSGTALSIPGSRAVTPGTTTSGVGPGGTLARTTPGGTVSTTGPGAGHFAKYAAAGTQPVTVAGHSNGRKGELKISLVVDGTGSMDRLIARVRKSLEEIAKRLAKEEKKCVIRIIIFRDYTDGQDLLETSEPMTDVTSLADWLGNIRADGGGDIPEAVEAGLARVLEIGGQDMVILAGDARSNTTEEINRKAPGRDFKTAAQLATEFKQKGIPVYTLVVGGATEAINDFKRIAKGSGGTSGLLDTSNATDTIDMIVMAALKTAGGSTGGTDAVNKYISERGGTMGTNALTFAANLRITDDSKR